jgi:hypothetical protein
MTRAVLALAFAGCFKPDPPGGLPCGTDLECPDGLRCSAGLCGGMAVAPDGQPDTPVIDPDGSRTCWEAWKSGAPVFGTPVRIDVVASAASEGNPSLSEDEKTLYFVRGGVGGRDIFLTQRASTLDPWNAPTKAAEFATGDDESKVSVAAGDSIAVISSSTAASMDLDLFQMERPAGGGAFANKSSAHLAAVDAVGSADVDPELTPDGLALYYSKGGLVLRFTTRSSIDGDFAAPSVVPGIPDGGADPAISPDQLVIVYTIDGAGRDLMFATRPAIDQPFGGITALSINSPQDDADAELSGDGCTLYYSSSRTGSVGSRDLYTVTVK